ncbi:radical SAM protein [Candidatus Fermentibacteria bacterium]|nr:radical SAM protein [Candidatus Fermentibacteria bacterium]
MDILFLNPPYLPKYSRSQRSPAVTRSGTLYYPMWLAYAAGVAEARGHRVQLVDAPAAGLGIEDILGLTPPHVVIMETSTPSIAADLKTASRMAERWAGCHVCLVGPHVTALPEDTLRSSSAHSVARGEYDETVADVADALEGRKDLNSVAGLSWKDDDAVIHNPPRPPLEDLDGLPPVSRTYARFLHFRDYFNPNALYPMVTIVSSRGCPYGCTFCVYPYTMTGLRQRCRDVRLVVDEMEEIVRLFPGVKAVFFEDDTLTARRDHVHALCEEIIRRDVRLSWTANARADVDGETLRLMKRAHARCLCVGFESGASEMLRRMGKHLEVDRARRFMSDARSAGIKVHGCFVVGMPGETALTMEQTLGLAIELDPDTAQFYPLMVYPGSPAYDEVRDAGLLVSDEFSHWLSPQGHHTAVARTGSLEPEDVARFCSYARRRFYLRPRFILRSSARVVTDGGERARILRATRSFWRHLLRP